MYICNKKGYKYVSINILTPNITVLLMIFFSGIYKWLFIIQRGLFLIVMEWYNNITLTVTYTFSKK